MSQALIQIAHSSNGPELLIFIVFQPKQEIASLLLLFLLSMFSKHWKTEGVTCSCGGGSENSGEEMVRKNLFLRSHIPPEKQQQAQHYTHLFPWHWYSVSTSRNTLLRLCPACFSMIYGKNKICQIFTWTQNTAQQEPLWQKGRPNVAQVSYKHKSGVGLGDIGPGALPAKLQTGPRAFQPGWAVWLWPSTTPRKPLRAVPSCLGETEAASKTKSYLYPVLIPRISLFAFPVRIYKL